MKHYFVAAVLFGSLTTHADAKDFDRAANIYGIITFAESHCLGYKVDDRRVWAVMDQLGVTLNDIERPPLRTKVVDVIEDLIKRQRKKGVSCDAAVTLFGPNGSSVRGLIIER